MYTKAAARIIPGASLSGYGAEGAGVKGKGKSTAGPEASLLWVLVSLSLYVSNYSFSAAIAPEVNILDFNYARSSTSVPLYFCLVLKGSSYGEAISLLDSSDEEAPKEGGVSSAAAVTKRFVGCGRLIRREPLHTECHSWFDCRPVFVMCYFAVASDIQLLVDGRCLE